jgi:hypothetical protein
MSYSHRSAVIDAGLLLRILHVLYEGFTGRKDKGSYGDEFYLKTTLLDELGTSFVSRLATSPRYAEK